MKRLVSLILSLILATALTSVYAQYPIVKKIGKDTVVIITLKQGNLLNKQYDLTQEQIKSLNDSIKNMKIQIHDTVYIYRYQVDSLGLLAKNYKDLYEQGAGLQLKKEEYHYKEKKLHAWHTLVLGLFLVLLASQ